MHRHVHGTKAWPLLHPLCHPPSHAPSNPQSACPPAAAEDQRKGLDGRVQKLTDDYVKQIDTLVRNKQEELSSI